MTIGVGYHHPLPLSWNLGTLTSWNPLGHSRTVTGLLYLYWAACEILTHLFRFSNLAGVGNKFHTLQWDDKLCENYCSRQKHTTRRATALYQVVYKVAKVDCQTEGKVTLSPHLNPSPRRKRGVFCNRLPVPGHNHLVENLIFTRSVVSLCDISPAPRTPRLWDVLQSLIPDTDSFDSFLCPLGN